MGISDKRFLATVLGSILLLSGCEEGASFNPFENFGQKNATQAASAQPTEGDGPATIEREVEAPDVFQTSEAGLWDGRPSLGGVWVAHPNVASPERVMIRNLDNGKFVVGALFRRELQNPGPKLQVSSDAAAELGLLAGAPTQLSVVALIREVVEVEPPKPEPILGGDDIEQTSLDPVATLAAAAIDAADSDQVKPQPRPVTETSTPAVTSNLAKPFVQIGIFSMKANADQTADLLRASGIIPTVKTFDTNGKPYWRVVVGPAATTAERTSLIKKVNGLGFGDAYAVTN